MDIRFHWGNRFYEGYEAQQYFFLPICSFEVIIHHLGTGSLQGLSVSSGEALLSHVCYGQLYGWLIFC
jgi:hypothetical protein